MIEVAAKEDYDRSGPFDPDLAQREWEKEEPEEIERQRYVVD